MVTESPSRTPESTLIPGPEGGLQTASSPIEGRKPLLGSSAYTLASIECPLWVTSCCEIPSGRPAATSSCFWTRSTPVVISVTGCSTCILVFISRKKNSPLLARRNSTVPAPT